MHARHREAALAAAAIQQTVKTYGGWRYPAGEAAITRSMPSCGSAQASVP